MNSHDANYFVTLLEKLIDQRINASRPQHEKRPKDDDDHAQSLVDLLMEIPEER